MNTLAWSIVPFLFFIIWLGVVIYVLTLIRRLTRATERIAASMERNLPGDDRGSISTAH
jgi:CcmD family protein